MSIAQRNNKEQHAETGYRPRPTPEALKKLVLKNTSRPFDDSAALTHLHDINPELTEADSRLIDLLLQ